MRPYNNAERSFGLVEIIIATSITAASLSVIFAVAVDSMARTADSIRRNQAILLLEEGAEAMLWFRLQSGGFTTNLSNTTSEICLTYLAGNPPIFVKSGPRPCWILLDNNYQVERTVSIASGQRDNATYNLTAAGSYDDGANTKLITLRVYWKNRKGVEKTEELSMYLTDHP